MDEPSAEELRELGNTAVKEAKYEEAIIHYTLAIKREPTNYGLYSNRSLAFLKVQQYYFALEDANETIKLNPSWAKGYFRRGEVEYATYQFAEACISYRMALQLKPDDAGIISAIARTLKQQQNDVRADMQIPWVGAGIGIVLGTLIVIADYVYTTKPTLTHPILMAVMTITIALVGYGIARLIRYYVKCQRDALLQAPIDLIEKEKTAADETHETSHSTPRYTKSQARQRYKKGKS